MHKLHVLKSDYRAAKISRRTFMEGALSLGVGLAAATAFVDEVRAQTPRKGGTVRLGIADSSTNETLNAATNALIQPQIANNYLRNCLVEIDHRSEPIPELAESWDSSPDAKTWTFKLRKGVTFHNGKSFEAEDVLHSINYHRNEESKSGGKGMIDQVADIKADGKNTVVFELKSGNADFPFIMSDYHFVIIPAGETNWDAGMGTGGYILEKFEPGVRILAKRNPNYWKEGRAHFDAIESLAINDIAARENALKDGSVDFINRCEPTTFKLLAGVAGVKTLSVQGTQHYAMPMRMNTAPFDNVDVRQALKHGIDREQIIQKILVGEGSLGNDHPISTANRYHNGDLPQRKFDADKAKFHLKKAGLDTLKIQLSAADSAFAGAVDTAVLFQQSAAGAGIEVEVVKEAGDSYWDQVWLKKPFCMSYWYGRPTEDWMLSMTYAAGADWNESVFTHEQFNKILVEARATLDEGKRREMYYELQRILYDEGATIIPMFANNLMAHSEKLTHGDVAKNSPEDGQRMPERWWFA